MRTLRRLLESATERKVVHSALTLYGVRSIKLDSRVSSGWPDRLFWVPGGRPLLIEFKKPGESLKPKQEHIANVLRDLGYAIEIHDDFNEAMGAIIRASYSNV